MTEHVQLGISTVMTGQILQSGAGETVAIADLVCLVPYIDGEQQRNFHMTPEQAMAIARALATAAGQLVHAEVDDNGAPLTPLARLTRLGRL